MYVNDRDQINYHGFLKALREMQGVNLKQVGEGICSDSEISRTEIGDRLPEKLMRDRITSRLGVSGEEYEEYLRPEEYRQWEIRMYILEQINKGALDKAEDGIEEFDKIPDKNPVQEQFVDAMRYMVAQMKGASDGLLSALIELAVARTIPDVDAAFKGVHLLADQELNLILEYIRFREYCGDKDGETAWRLEEYQKILDYVDASYMDTIGKSKIYPRVTCFICDLILKSNPTTEYLEYALELCHNSIELLRDASRLYYFVELLEYRKEIITLLLALEKTDDEKVKGWKSIYEKDSEWETLFKELYTEYEVPVYMQNFTYLYVETECNNAVEVIRIRRKMVKLSRLKVSDGICTEKTIERFENYINSPSIVVVRDVFERIGLCAEYKRARVITDNAEVFKIYKKLINSINDFKNEDAKLCLEELKEKLHMEIPYNEQELKRVENLLAVRERKLDKNAFYKNTIRAFECTLPIWAIISYKRNMGLYLTRAELACLYDIAFKTDGELQCLCVEIIKEKCLECSEEDIKVAQITVFELLIDGIANYLGNQGDYAESTRFSVQILRKCLTHRRAAVIADNLYNILWNYQENTECSIINGNSAKDILQKCALLCELIRKDNWVIFYKEKLQEYFND